MLETVIGAADNIQEKENAYTELRADLKRYFNHFNITDPNKFSSLVEFYGYYRSKMGKVEQKLDIVKKIYEKTENEINTIIAKETAKKITAPSSEIFVAYGRNEKARSGIFAFLRAIGLRPLEWTHLIAATRKGSPYIGEALERGFSKVKAVVILLTPDDEGKLRDCFLKEDDSKWESQLCHQARLNVIFEAGIAFGCRPDQTVIVELGALRPFSDIIGRHVVRLDNSPEKRKELAERLRTLGCPVDLTGNDWLKIVGLKVVSTGLKCPGMGRM